MKTTLFFLTSFIGLSAFATYPTGPVMIDHNGYKALCSDGMTFTATEMYDAHGRYSFLPPGSRVHVCDSRRTSTGLYKGIVVGHHCNLDPAPAAFPYEGRCPSGWVRAEFLQTY